MKLSERELDLITNALVTYILENRFDLERGKRYQIENLIDKLREQKQKLESESKF